MTPEEHNAGMRNLVIVFMLLAIGVIIWTQLPDHPNSEEPKPKTPKNYQAAHTHYKTERGFGIDRVIIGTDTLYCSYDYKTIILK